MTKQWVLHAPGERRLDGHLDPLCGQVTGHGSKGCDQAIIVKAGSVTCKKCLAKLSKSWLRRPICPNCCKDPCQGYLSCKVASAGAAFQKRLVEP